MKHNVMPFRGLSDFFTIEQDDIGGSDSACRIEFDFAVDEDFSCFDQLDGVSSGSDTASAEEFAQSHFIIGFRVVLDHKKGPCCFKICLMR